MRLDQMRGERNKMQDSDYETMSRDDAAWEKNGVLIFRWGNHWDYDIMACRNYRKEVQVAHCKRDAFRGIWRPFFMPAFGSNE